jgi:hypothetical protein
MISGTTSARKKQGRAQKPLVGHHEAGDQAEIPQLVDRGRDEQSAPGSAGQVEEVAGDGGRQDLEERLDSLADEVGGMGKAEDDRGGAASRSADEEGAGRIDEEAIRYHCQRCMLMSGRSAGPSSVLQLQYRCLTAKT